MTANSETAVQYFLSRSLIGLGYYTLVSLLIAYSSKIVPYEKLGFVSGIYKLSFALAVFASPAIGNFFVAKYSISELYFAIGVAMLSVFFMLLPLPRVDSTESIDLKSLISLVKNKTARMLMLVTFLSAIPGVFFYTYLSIFLNKTGYTHEFIKLIYTVMGVGTIIAAFMIIFLSD